MDTSNLTPLRLPSQSNWLKFIEMEQAGNLECYGGSEYPLYSDVGIRGEISDGLGPYALLNALPMGSGTNAEIVMVLRSFIFESCRPERFSTKLKTDVQRFHGGHLPEEITALISLGLGIRLKAGEANRHFDGSDRLGRFRAYSSRPKPSLLVNPERPIIPMPKDVPLKEIEVRLRTIPKLNAVLYIELVRAARAYQDALWISETEPHLAWLLLVTSIEIAANAQFSSAGSSTENLKELKPDLAQMVKNAGGEKLLSEVADDLKGLFGATKKFLMFCEEFMPAEPSERPSLEGMRVEWAWSSLRPILNTVYSLRSNALHAGVPFPAPMCQRPDRWHEDNVPAERAITSLAIQTMNAQWVPKDAPIAIHMFQYFVRGALLNWWDRITSNE